jgi:hypothetical protein
MTIRTIAVSVLLGLPAALLAHAGVFHGNHTVGGAAHGILVILSIVCAALAAAAALSPRSLRRLGAAPPVAGTIASAAVWFAFIELRESPHTIAVLPCFVAVCLAAWIVIIAWHGFARAADGVARQFFARLRPPFRQFATICRTPVHAFGSLSPTYRLFSRPPPV